MPTKRARGGGTNPITHPKQLLHVGGSMVVSGTSFSSISLPPVQVLAIPKPFEESKSEETKVCVVCGIELPLRPDMNQRFTKITKNTPPHEAMQRALNKNGHGRGSTIYVCSSHINNVSSHMCANIHCDAGVGGGRLDFNARRRHRGSLKFVKSYNYKVNVTSATIVVGDVTIVPGEMVNEILDARAHGKTTMELKLCNRKCGKNKQVRAGLKLEIEKMKKQTATSSSARMLPPPPAPPLPHPPSAPSSKEKTARSPKKKKIKTKTSKKTSTSSGSSSSNNTNASDNDDEVVLQSSYGPRRPKTTSASDGHQLDNMLDYMSTAANSSNQNRFHQAFSPPRRRTNGDDRRAKKQNRRTRTDPRNPMNGPGILHIEGRNKRLRASRHLSLRNEDFETMLGNLPSTSIIIDLKHALRLLYQKGMNECCELCGSNKEWKVLLQRERTVYYFYFSCGCAAEGTRFCLKTVPDKQSREATGDYVAPVWDAAAIGHCVGFLENGKSYDNYAKISSGGGLCPLTLDQWNELEAIYFVECAAPVLNELTDMGWALVIDPRPLGTLGARDRLFVKFDAGYSKASTGKNAGGTSTNGIGNLTDALSGVLLDVAQTDQRYNKMFDIPGAKIEKEVKPGVWKEYTIDSNSLEVHLFTRLCLRVKYRYNGCIAYLLGDGDIDTPRILHLIFGRRAYKVYCWIHKVRTMYMYIENIGRSIQQKLADESGAIAPYPLSAEVLNIAEARRVALEKAKNGGSESLVVDSAAVVGVTDAVVGAAVSGVGVVGVGVVGGGDGDGGGAGDGAGDGGGGGGGGGVCGCGAVLVGGW